MTEPSSGKGQGRQMTGPTAKTNNRRIKTMSMLQMLQPHVALSGGHCARSRA